MFTRLFSHLTTLFAALSPLTTDSGLAGGIGGYFAGDVVVATGAGAAIDATYGD